MEHFPWWVLIPLAAISIPVVTSLIANRSRLKELELRQGMGPEIEDVDQKLDEVLLKLDRLEKKLDHEKE
ncbi:hypothetical protein JCM19046_2369 [Bacillus sp. JCM 19046]|uniref:Phage shock protein B n=1 Tax=Shouchella xiaoxiensis TaxID=766895 RepID=A0ABS2SWX7_9BACI|nr:hypothetical protein [Shouchella xiaoxiensis]MBM7840037.1 hypothetical protein [Shouchella xiaoxiensis]GAF12602.1 hypothetical protein JCM19045_1808 [Bacillus sp. JCM 19045]GAF17838.1 hypothetical protein JCM19046_2369 [Bacillus sp. JCM 19046]